MIAGDMLIANTVTTMTALTDFIHVSVYTSQAFQCGMRVIYNIQLFYKNTSMRVEQHLIKDHGAFAATPTLLLIS